MSFIKTIDMLQEDYSIPDELITAILHSLFEKSAKRWYYGISQTNGKNSLSWWKQEIITKQANYAWRYKMEKEFENSFFDPDKDKTFTWFLKKAERLNALYLEMSQKMVHMKILKKFGGELEHSLRSRCIEPCSTEEYINALEDIVTRTKIDSTLKKLDIKSPNKPFIKKDEPRENFKHNTSNSNEKRRCHKCGEDHNDEEKESYSEKDTEESETSESDESTIINSQTNNIDLVYEVLDVNSNLPQVGISNTILTSIQDAKLYRTKPEKGIGYTAGKSSISIVMVENQESKVNLDTGAYCTCVGKSYLKTIVPDWEEKLIPIQGVKFGSAIESMKPLGKIDLKLIFPHPSQCIRLKVEFVVIYNCTTEKLKEAEFNHELTEKLKEKLIDLLFKYQNAFATDKEPLGAIIGHEVVITLDVEKRYPPLSRRPAYPASPRAREDLEVHIKELMDLRVLQKVGHNEQVDVTTPVIITWHNGRSRMVGYFRALMSG
ncbi:hypothetical protein O181_100521 [Austropuccinia psidii MF-1]|uniref:Uncharacterized protein n=1 Tax=Austropuccinia psidii MF-1 TaxID=1389203 RepID=A0A9Q3JFI5_9BASI|nr:hypothetical protein [Austropuccinia psidii MF-1]